MRTKEELKEANRRHQKTYRERHREEYLIYKREWGRKKRLQNRKERQTPEQSLWSSVSVWSLKHEGNN